MKATYRITESDYVNAMKLGAKPSPKLKGIFLTVVLALILLSIFAQNPVRAIALFFLIYVPLVLLARRYIFIPIIARRHYRKYKAIHEEFTVELLDEGIHKTSPNGDGKITWDKIYKWRQNEKYILLYPMPKLFYIIPKSVEAGGFDIPLLINQLTQHVGKPT